MRLSARRVGWRWTRVRAAPRNAAIDRSWRIPDATPSATAIPETQLISQARRSWLQELGLAGLLEAFDEFFDVLGAVTRADEGGVLGLDNNEIADADEGGKTALGKDDVFFCIDTGTFA